MNERIRFLTERTLDGSMYVPVRKTEFGREDLLLEKQEREVKRLCEYIMNQEPLIFEQSCFTGFFNFDGSVVGDVINVHGHKETNIVMGEFYLKPVDNLSTMEWQHSAADFAKLKRGGLKGIIEDIDKSIEAHDREEEKNYLLSLRRVTETLIAWAHKCADRCDEFYPKVSDPEYAQNIKRLGEALRRVPENAPSNFYEAVLSLFVCFSVNPDSLGTLDRYLSSYYDRDISSGAITREKAAEYLSELFLMVQSVTRRSSANFTKGGNSHFCVGGYLPDGTDGFNETSRLIIDTLVSLPIYIPQVTFRWTSTTPREVLRYVMDAERRDPYKRIAFTSDEKRIKSYTEVCKIPYERAVNYTMVGCNEPAVVGSPCGSNSKINILRCVERMFHDMADETAKAASFDEFYAMFEREMSADLLKGYEYDNKYNAARARDVNYISSILFDDCIENARSVTRGGCDYAICSPMLLGLTNVIDSLIIVKQFVFDEKRVSMQALIDAVKANWKGHEALRTEIEKKGDFFGNDTDRSNAVARRLYESFYQLIKDRTNIFGYHFLIADTLGYNEHHKWFGERTAATPDGRYDGEMLKICIGQNNGRDRSGLPALLNSVAQIDEHAVACGSTAFNLSLDSKLVTDDAAFEKTVDLMQTFFKKGGVQFQLTYVSREDLVNAKAEPDKYKSIRVRVTGFSDYFVNLTESIQDDIISRTENKA